MFGFLPQFLTVGFIGYWFRKNQALAWFLQTFTFVAMNKVVTSQYFMWYLGLLPLVIGKTRIGAKTGVLMIAAWILGQAMWLYFAYYLEFEGQNNFLQLFASSSIFYLIQTSIVAAFVYNDS